MDNRLYFILGDLLANVTTGAVVGGLCWLIVGHGWNMWLTMFVMMFFGMTVALILFFVFSYFFGAMEVMVPTMLSGMMSGMFVSMRVAMHPTSAETALLIGAVTGLACIIVVWIMNSRLRGIVVNP